MWLSFKAWPITALQLVLCSEEQQQQQARCHTALCTLRYALPRDTNLENSADRDHEMPSSKRVTVRAHRPHAQRTDEAPPKQCGVPWGIAATPLCRTLASGCTPTARLPGRASSGMGAEWQVNPATAQVLSSCRLKPLAAWLSCGCQAHPSSCRHAVVWQVSAPCRTAAVRRPGRACSCRAAVALAGRCPRLPPWPPCLPCGPPTRAPSRRSERSRPAKATRPSPACARRTPPPPSG